MAEITEKKPRAPRKPKAAKNVEEITSLKSTNDKEIVVEDRDENFLVLKEETTPKDEVLETPKEITPKEEIKETPKLKVDAEPVVAVLSPENPQDLVPVQPILKPENPQDLKPIQTEIAKKEEKKLPEITEKKVLTPDSEEVTKAPLPKKGLELELKKLNPNLEDGKSKWSFRAIEKGSIHEVFRGSFVRACKWAENYCTKHNIDIKNIQKIRK